MGHGTEQNISQFLLSTRFNNLFKYNVIPIFYSIFKTFRNELQISPYK